MILLKYFCPKTKGFVLLRKVQVESINVALSGPFFFLYTNFCLLHLRTSKQQY
jgi:hypothetical protein